MTRKVFIDAGAYDGDSVRAFRAKYPYAEQYEIHCFEPDPRCAPAYVGLGVQFYPQAVLTYDGRADLFLGDPESSSLFRDKTSGHIDREHPFRVCCLDFSRWIMDEFCLTDHLVLKIDIEGAEYPVLEKMLEDDMLRAVRDLFVDWHYDRVGIPVERHNALLERLKATGIPLHDCSRGHFLEYA